MRDRSALWAELDEMLKRPDPVQPHEFTVSELSERYGRSTNGTKKLMEKYVREGTWASRKATSPQTGGYIIVYWKVADGTQDR